MSNIFLEEIKKYDITTMGEEELAARPMRFYAGIMANMLRGETGMIFFGFHPTEKFLNKKSKKI